MEKAIILEALGLWGVPGALLSWIFITKYKQTISGNSYGDIRKDMREMAQHISDMREHIEEMRGHIADLKTNVAVILDRGNR